MNPDRSKTAAFSGHRSFKIVAGGDSLFDDPWRQSPEAISERLREAVGRLAEEGYTDFLCGMAEGFDLMAGEAVLDVRRTHPDLRLVAVIPFEGQADGFNYETREIYDRVLAAADRAIVVCRQYSVDCFHRRNDSLADMSSALICYYNGSPGGTRYTVKRALRNGSKIINLI